MLVFFTDLLHIGRSWVDSPIFCSCFAVLWLKWFFGSVEDKDVMKSKEENCREVEDKPVS